MTIPLRQSTASQEIPLGYFLDSTDGNEPEISLTIANTDIKLWKHGATTLANKNSGGATHISDGIYYCVLDDTDTNTLGGLIAFVHVTGALAVKVECEVLPANVYDSLVAGTDNLQVDSVEISGDSTAADNLELDYDGTGYAKSNSTIGTCTANTDMVGTDNAALAATALTDVTWTDAKAAFLDASIQTVDTVVDAVKAKTDSLPSGIAKNVALSGFNFLMVLSSDHVTPATGKTITGTLSKDGAAFAALTNAVSEIASGMYKVDITQAEMNADVVTLKFSETDCDQRIITIYTS